MQASGCATDGGPDPPLWARHPTQFSISCDGHIFVTRARWQHWGRSTARATATLVVEKCDPSCATGPQRRIAVTVVATHVTDCVGRLVYRSVVLHWTQSGRRRTSEGPPQGCFHR
jgi:hypothetical protein